MNGLASVKVVALSVAALVAVLAVPYSRETQAPQASEAGQIRASQPGDLIWRMATGGNIDSSPTVANGVIYFGSDDHHLYALEADSGKLVWGYRTGGKVASTPTVANGIVYFGSEDNYVYALRTDTGRLLWRYGTGDDVNSSPAVADGVVYVGSDDNFLYALKANTGELLWRYETGGNVDSAPVVMAGVVYVSTNDGYLYALDADSSSTTESPVAPAVSSPAPSTPATPTPGSTSTPEPIRIRGTGSMATGSVTVPYESVIVSISHRISRSIGHYSFSVTAYGKNVTREYSSWGGCPYDARLLRLWLQRGSYRGEVPLSSCNIKSLGDVVGENLGEVVFEIKAPEEGEWEIEIRPLHASPEVTSAGFLGNGDSVSGVFEAPGVKFWRLEHDGESNFTVWAYCDGDTPELIGNAIGKVSVYRVAELPTEGYCILVVGADGSFSVTPHDQ